MLTASPVSACGRTGTGVARLHGQNRFSSLRSCFCRCHARRAPFRLPFRILFLPPADRRLNAGKRKFRRVSGKWIRSVRIILPANPRSTPVQALNRRKTSAFGNRPSSGNKSNRTYSIRIVCNENDPILERIASLFENRHRPEKERVQNVNRTNTIKHRRLRNDTVPFLFLRFRAPILAVANKASARGTILS